MVANVKDAFDEKAPLRTELAALHAEANQAPLLSVEQEKELGRRIKHEDDDTAREELIRANLRLVIYFAKRYRNRGVSFADLIAEGKIGLREAAQDYDYERARFSTHAAWLIKRSLKACLEQQARSVRIPGYMHTLRSNIEKAKREYLKKHGNQKMSVQELAVALGVKAEKIEECLEVFNAQTQSIDKPLGQQDQRRSYTLLNFFEAQPAHNCPNMHAIREMLSRELFSPESCLNDNERAVLCMRFALGGYADTWSFRQIAPELRVTPSRAQQIEQEALKKLRAKYKVQSNRDLDFE